MIAWYMGLPSVSGLRRGTSTGAQTCSRFARELSPGNADLRSDLAYRPSVRCGDDLDRRSSRAALAPGMAASKEAGSMSVLYRRSGCLVSGLRHECAYGNTGVSAGLTSA